MSNVSMAFILTFIAGGSTLIGTIPIFLKLKKEDSIICGSLAFASGVMLCVSITDLIPESINMLSKSLANYLVIILTFMFIMIGIFISNFISSMIPSNEGIKKNNMGLYKVGLISMLAIIIHNVPEGIATFISTTKSVGLGLSLTLAIALHNIPEGVSISVPIYYSTKSKVRAFFYTLISALSEPLGALLTYLFLFNFINDVVLGLLFALIAGIMLQISLTELLPTSLKYGKVGLTKLFFGIGIVFMLFKFVF